MRCIENIAEWCDKNGVDGRIEYVLEAGCNHEKDAVSILDRVAQSAELTRRYRWAKYSFVSKGPENPWLFAPDLYAWEWQRMDQNSENRQRGEWRMTLADLFEAKPHIGSYLKPESVAIRAMINSFYGLTRA